MDSVIYQLWPTKRFHGDSAQYGTNGLIMSGKCSASVSLTNVDVTTDTLTFDVNADALIGEAVEDFRTMQPGDDMYLSAGGTMFYKWYLQTLTRVNKRTLRFVLTTGVGLLDAASPHMGGIYTGQTAKTVIDDIFSAVPSVGYAVDANVETIHIYGHLPIDSRKANLARLLQAIGANMTVNGNNYVIAFESASATPRQIADAYVYEGYGGTQQRNAATGVEITEHAFYALASDRTVVLFDNTAEQVGVSNQLVEFDEPCHDLTVTGTLTIGSSGENYAVVSGKGTLTGQQYTHTLRVIKRSTGVSGPENIVKVEDNELVGTQNSDYLASRISKYYALTKSATIEALDANGGIYPGMRVQFADAFGDTMTGWVEKKDFELGSKNRAQMKIAVNWSPGPFGNNVDTYVLFKTAGAHTWTVPAGVTKIRMALGSGGTGGNGGTAGTNGSDGATANTSPTPGSGGSKGTAGSAGKILAPSVEYTVTPGDTLTISVGAGGAGGAANGGTGSAGGHTTIVINGNTYSSSAGSVQPKGYQNLDSGEVYGQAARDGFDGADGGSWISGEEAGDVNAGDAIYIGGDPGVSETRTTGGGVKVYMYGGGGSGAVYGHYGADGGNRVYNSRLDFYGGDGGDAPTPDALPDVPTCSSGGAGGNGGGGGGAGGNAWRDDGHDLDHANPGRGGYGSSGSAGKAGGDGFCLIMYKSA